MSQTQQRTSPRRFHLHRTVDESGMSGVGRVAEGVELPNGVVVMWWLRPPHSVQQYRSAADLIYVHGHGARATTSLVWEEDAGVPS